MERVSLSSNIPPLTCSFVSDCIVWLHTCTEGVSLSICVCGVNDGQIRECFIRAVSSPVVLVCL